MTTQPCDVVVFGATSFVGQILTRYLFEEFGLDRERETARFAEYARRFGL